MVDSTNVYFINIIIMGKNPKILIMKILSTNLQSKIFEKLILNKTSISFIVVYATFKYYV